MGETAATYSAGALSLKEAVYIVYHRGRIQGKQANLGKILAVHIEIEEAKKDIMGYGNRISIATINGPNIVTIAGDTEPLRQLAKLYTERKALVKSDMEYELVLIDATESPIERPKKSRNTRACHRLSQITIEAI
ncbi:Acyltransferase domain-containing protein [Candidatus Megaera venefica]|uniref:Acyltransferase domain-containing protein n=1 Tax=Candidatus Megaera venefica TaxID=2055910 RepID=A0ABU5NEY7_9RICK|nr:Acyltransferase domain-containing protein [Candidatus Megaera venefica]